MDVQELLDREAIRRTLARYTLSGDRGRVDALVECFTPEGVLKFEHEWTARGQAEIRRRVAEARDLTARARVTVLLRHHLSTQDVERISPDEARACSYFTAMTSAGPDHVGRYVDRLVRTGEGWRIRHRLVRVEWWSPRTIYRAQAARARLRDRAAREGGGVPPESGGIRVERREGVGRLVLDHPQTMNRIEGTMREEILSALRHMGADPDVRCIVVTGAGGVFSAGADVDGMAKLHRRGDAGEIHRRVAMGAEIVRAIRAMSKPVVAVVDGVAAGAGMNLALACDLRVGSSRAAFVSNFVRIGLVPDWGGLYFLARRVGTGRATDLMLTGRRVDAARALEIGLLDRLFPDESFARDLDALLAQLAAAPGQAVMAIKEGLDVGTDAGLEAVLAFEEDTQPRLFLTDDCREGIDAFLEKRAPRFGR